MRATMPAGDVDRFFQLLSSLNPDPRGELDYVNEFTLLVAVVLSAQATDAGVNKATGPLFRIADTPEKMAELGEEALRGHIRTIGLYRNKAKNVIALSEMLLSDFGGRVPDNRDDLMKLPGVGRKTANVVLNIAFGQPTMAVDTHIFRIGNRTGMAPRKDAGGCREEARPAHSRQVAAARASLADPARALRVQGAQAGLSGLRRARSLPLRRENCSLTAAGRRQDIRTGTSVPSGRAAGADVNRTAGSET